MGMTDHQFDTYQEALVRDLERMKEEVAELTGGKECKTLERVLQDIRAGLRKP